MSKLAVRALVYVSLAVLFFPARISLPVLAQEKPQNPPNSTFFVPGNLVVAVEGCGVHGGTCTNIPNGTGTGAGTSSAGGYGDNQASPLTLFQYSPNGTSSVSFVNSLVMPQSASGANGPVSSEYGSSSEATVQLSGGGQYLTIMGYGVGDAAFNANPTLYGVPGGELAQSVSLTGQAGITPVPRVVTLIDANGNVNSSTAVFNVFNTNNPRSAFTANGTTAYISGQGASSDATQGVFYVPVGSVTTAPTAITGLDAVNSSNVAISQDTRTVQIFNNTLYVSTDTKGGTGSARSFVGTLGTPPATGLFNSAAGPTQLNGFGTSKTGKLTITTGANSNGNNLNSGQKINLSPVNYFFASSSVLYVADGGKPKNDSNGDTNTTGTANIGDGGLQKWVNISGNWTLEYTLYQGLNLVNNGGTDGNSGLYGLTGVVVGGNVLLYATNYTLNDLDPTFLYGISDTMSFTTATQAAGETFTVLDTAPSDSNFKGVSFAPSIPAGSVEVTTSPSGLPFTSSGTGCAPGSYTSPITLAWTPGSTCALTVTTPQSAGTGVQYAFSDWEDGTTSTSHVVTAPSTTATYTATFNTQYLLTTSAGTGGTVSAGGYYNSGSTANITATPSSGYYFVNFTGTSTSTSNPFLLVMNSPQTITANFSAQTPQAINFTMQAPASAAYGSSFTVAATGGASGNPVVFTSSGYCSNVGATYTMTSATGVCSVIANQAGNTDYLAAPTVTETTNATTASTTLNVTSVNPPSEDYGLDSQVTITAVLSWTGTGAAPTGAVTIGGNGPSSYGTTSCSPASGTSITCTNTYTPTATDVPGSYTESASFAGDSNYNTSSSSQTNNFTINQATSSVTVGSSVNPSAFGQSVTFTATVSGENGLVKGRKNGVRKQVVTGSVTWSPNTGCSSTAIDASGNATCTTSSLPIGNNTITASYAGDSNHSGSTGTLSGGQQVNQATTTISVTSVNPPSEDYGLDSQVTITAVLSWTGAGAAPTGAVTIGGNGPSSYGTITCSPASGTTITCTNTYLPTASDTAGFYTESASFAGDGNYSASSSSQSNNFIINPATASVAVTSNLNPSVFGQSVMFTAAISGENGLLRSRNNGVRKQVVTGSVTWSSNTGCGTTPVTSGVATCTTTALPGGTNTITAAYSGDANHGASTGTLSGGEVVNPASQTVSFTTNPPASAAYNSNFTVAASASSNLPVTYSSAGSCSNSGANYTITSGSGTCTVTASQPGNANYSAATPVGNFTMATKAAPTVSFTGAPSSAPYNSTFVLTATTNSSAVASITGTNPSICQLSGSTSPVTVNMLKDAGTCKFTATWAADANYTGTTATQTTLAVKAATTISWSTPAPISYGTPLSSTQLDAVPSQPGNLVYAPAAGRIEALGTTTLKVTLTPSNTNYLGTSTTVNLQVVQATTTTTITSNSTTVTQNVNGIAYATLDYQVTSYRPTGSVTLTASSGESCSSNVNMMTGNGSCRLTFTTPGTRTIVASYGGDTNHTGSNSSQQSPAITVTVNPHK